MLQKENAALSQRGVFAYEINNQKHKKNIFLKSAAKVRKICEMSKKSPDFVKSILQNYKICI